MKKKILYTLLCTTMIMTGQTLGAERDKSLQQRLDDYERSLTPIATKVSQKLAASNAAVLLSPTSLGTEEGIATLEEQRNQKAKIASKRLELLNEEVNKKLEQQKILEKENNEEQLREIETLVQNMMIKDQTLEQLKTTNEQLKSGIDTLEQIKKELETEISQVKTEISQVKTENSTLQASRTKNTQRLFQELAKVSTELSNARSKEADLQARVKELEGVAKVKEEAQQQYRDKKTKSQQQAPQSSSSASSTTSSNSADYDSDEDTKGSITGKKQ